MKLAFTPRALCKLDHGARALSRREPRQIRRAPHGNYVIFYRLRAETVEVLRVLHGARDLDGLVEDL